MGIHVHKYVCIYVHIYISSNSIVAVELDSDVFSSVAQLTTLKISGEVFTLVTSFVGIKV